MCPSCSPELLDGTAGKGRAGGQPPAHLPTPGRGPGRQSLNVPSTPSFWGARWVDGNALGAQSAFSPKKCVWHEVWPIPDSAGKGGRGVRHLEVSSLSMELGLTCGRPGLAQPGPGCTRL